MQEIFRNHGYLEIRTPSVLIRAWERSGHWENFRENMFITRAEGVILRLNR
jgi:threonyl-tRNA synthetase